ncbi:uncharacterized protein LOC114520790, partial [Dendronephthya gigantea]|uniref:uncharacterized protein LOC114520790 n=1 Tax=Dendronephthya gigantea TaxID=151771 RepID=UPI00106D122B
SESEDGELYDNHEQACKKFFNIQKSFPSTAAAKLDGLKGKKGEVYDITGLNALNVIAMIASIINNRDKWKTNKIFYFLITKSSKLFKIKALPSDDQPGNGLVYPMFLNNGKYVEEKSTPDYEGITKELCEAKTSIQEFAEAIQKLFKNNLCFTHDEPAIGATASPGKTDYDDLPQRMSRVSLDPSKKLLFEKVYFLLLFEIARRLSGSNNKTDEGEQLDNLPVGSAIARKILLALDVKNKEDGEKTEILKKELTSLFDCFKYDASTRKDYIKEIIKYPAPNHLSCEAELSYMFL